jgi:hypothetical protein
MTLRDRPSWPYIEVPVRFRRCEVAECGHGADYANGAAVSLWEGPLRNQDCTASSHLVRLMT